MVSNHSGSARYEPVGEPGRSTDLGGRVKMLNPKESVTTKRHGMTPKAVLVQIEEGTGVDTWQPTEAL